ncbi:hypothetical protein BC826DRAFT_551225 [Russula brevipes]|nr:hypothetical protein BC826DRAFT_551225 [Russula brevipes]
MNKAQCRSTTAPTAARKSQLTPTAPSRHDCKKPGPTGDTPLPEKSNRTHHREVPPKEHPNTEHPPRTRPDK